MIAMRGATTILGVVLAGTAAMQVHAQGAASFPAKPIRMIVPLAAGGPSDTLARILAVKMSEAIGQNVIVDNRPGASGIIGIEMTAKSPPDGYTIALVSNTISINPAIFKKVPYEFDKDLDAVSLIAATPYILTVHPSLPVKTVKDLIELAKKRPGELNHASGGSGTGPHLAMEVLTQRAGIRIVQLVYTGGGPAMIDFLAGQTQLFLSNMVTAMPQIRAGKMRALAVTSTKRSSVAPEVPTLEETGMPGFEEGGQHGIVSPAGVPKEILAKLHAAIAVATRNPDLVKRLADEGSEAVGSTPEVYREIIRRETAKWKKVVAASGIRQE